jgi:NAD(P)-dependent dehydrogenase (short-subunit alcohol dehydrogenase family)
MTPDSSSLRALIVGAGSPFGAAVASAVAERGADVALLTATADAEEAFAVRRLAKRIADGGGRAFAESVDAGNGAAVQVAVRQVAKQLGGIDLLVAAPDLRLSRPAERLGDADWSRVVNGNLGAVFFACRAAAREMLANERAGEAPRGRIVVLLPSLDGVEAAGNAPYLAAWAGVDALIPALAEEWDERGIAVNGVGLPSSTEDAEQAAVVATVVWLASPESDGTTGRVIAAG